jgi:S1-C subfamily serine protease
MRRTTQRWWLACLALAITALVGTLHVASAATRPWLGVYTQEITGELRDGLDLHGDGVLVNRVVDGGPADRAGVHNGDLILKFNSHAVTSPDALARLVGDAREGQKVSLVVSRHGENHELTATLAPRPGDDADE